MKINLSVYELWFWRISIIGLIIFNLYLFNTRPITIERTTIYYATFTPEGEVKVENPQVNKSMGCNIYWRAKGYPCFNY